MSKEEQKKIADYLKAKRLQHLKAEIDEKLQFTHVLNLKPYRMQTLSRKID